MRFCVRKFDRAAQPRVFAAAPCVMHSDAPRNICCPTGVIATVRALHYVHESVLPVSHSTILHSFALMGASVCEHPHTPPGILARFLLP